MLNLAVCDDEAAAREELAGKLECITLELSDYQIMEEEPVVQQWVNGKLGDRARAVRYGNHGED